MTHLTIPEVAEVAKISPAQIRRWMKSFSGMIIKNGDKRSDGRGVDTLFDTPTITQLVIAARLIAVGVAVRDALEAAALYRKTENSTAQGIQNKETGQTWLFILEGSPAIYRSENRDELSGFENHFIMLEKAESLLLKPQAALGDLPSAIISVNLTGISEVIERRVMRVLHSKRPHNTRLHKDETGKA